MIWPHFTRLRATEPVKNRAWIQTQICPVQTLCCTMWYIWFCYKLILFYSMNVGYWSHQVVYTVQHNPDNQDGINTLDAFAGAASVMLQITLWTWAPVLQDAGVKIYTLSPPFSALTTTITWIQHLHQARKIHESNLQVPCALVSTDIDGWRLLRAYQKLFLINKMNLTLATLLLPKTLKERNFWHTTDSQTSATGAEQIEASGHKIFNDNTGF